MRVPRLSDSRIQQEKVPGVRVSTSSDPEAFNGGASAQRVAQSVQGVSDTVLKIAANEKKKADDSMVLEAAGKYAQLEVDFDKEMRQRRGKNAFTLPEEFEATFEKSKAEIDASLANDDQRARLAQVSQRYYYGMKGSVNAHVAQETKAVEQASFKSFVENESNAAINSFNNPVRIKQSIDAQKDAISLYAKNNGLDEETKKAMTTDAVSKTHVGVIDNLIQTNTAAAKEYYSLNKKEINSANMSEADLDKKIMAYQTANVAVIEDDLQNKEMENTLRPEDIYAVNKPIEEGGIGAKKANMYLKRIKEAQIAQWDRIVKLIPDNRAEEGQKYIDMVDKFVKQADVSSRYTLNEMILNAYADGEISNEEKKQLNDLKNVFSEIQENKAPSPWNLRFTKSLSEIRGIVNRSEFASADVADALKKVINYGLEPKEDSDQMDDMVKSVTKEMQIKKNPNNATPLGLQQNKKGAWVVVVEKADGSLGVRAARPDEIKTVK